MTVKPSWTGIRLAASLCGLMVVLSLSTFTAQASSSLSTFHYQISKAKEDNYISRYFGYLEDATGKLDIEDIIDITPQAWQPTRKDTPDFGYTASSIWAVARITNLPGHTSQWYLEIPYAMHDYIDAYIIAEKAGHQKVTQHYQYGDMRPFHVRPIENRNPVIPINFEEAETLLVYIRISTEGSMKIPLKLWDTQSFSAANESEVLWNGIYFGTLLIMILYNFFMFLAVRDINLLFYIAYVFSHLIVRANVSGLSFQYLWPEATWFNNLSIVLSLNFILISVCIYTYHFLDLKHGARWISRTVLTSTLVFIALGISCLFLPYQMVVLPILLCIIVSTFSITALSGYLWIKGMRTARFFFIAWAVFLVSALINVSAYAGLAPLNAFTYNSVIIGSMIEMALLSLAFGDRINQEKQAKLMMQEKNKAKTQFFASMSHEFRTPLTAILGYTELAKKTSTTNEARLDYVKTISSSAEHMLQLINDVLDLSKIEAQKLDVEKVPVELINLTQKIKDSTWILAEQKNISFDIQPQFPLPATFLSDPTRLKQALVNLCSNAVKFTSEGGVSIVISCDVKQQQLLFSVKDTGIGLKPEQFNNLFKVFSQADQSTSRNYGGTGLGLHLSRLIANKLGGDITVESEYGVGSNFILSVATGDLDNIEWLNELKETKTTSIQNPATVSKDVDHTVTELHQGLKIIVAEDNVVNQQLISFHLKQAKAEVTIANNGKEALAYGITMKADLILMDMDMPEMDGPTATRYLRDIGIQTRIVALTGNTSEASIKECLNAGCDDHLSKPIDLDKLICILESLRC